MNDELYNLWIRRADAEAPADFADRVMDAVRREPLPSSKGVVVPLLTLPQGPRSGERGYVNSKGVVVLLLTLPAVRVAACVLASLACLCRMAAVVAVFFPQ